MKLLKFRKCKKTFEYYKTHVAGNKDCTYFMAQRKMTRNMLLAKKVDSTGYDGQMYCYGRLWFLIDDAYRIVWMRNGCGMPEDWMLDKKKYIELTKELGIDNSVNEIDLNIKEVQHSFKRFTRELKRSLQHPTYA